MIQFEYRGTKRQALELGVDKRQIGCMVCFQVTPEVGRRSFKVHDMRDVTEIDRAPFEELFEANDIDNKPERPPHPLDLAFWTIDKEPRFDEEFFMEETRAFIRRNDPWKRDE